MSKLTNNQLIQNVKNADGFVTSIPGANHPYQNMIYGSNKHKFAVMFSPRGGCSISFKCLLDKMGILEEAIAYNNWIHSYRCDIFYPNTPKKNIDNVLENKVQIIKFVLNPYIRAISIYRAQSSHNYSFRDYLKKLNNKTIQLNPSDNYHHFPQYVPGEEKYVSQYVKLDKKKVTVIKTEDGKEIELNPNNFSAPHHIRKFNRKEFLGDIPKNKIIRFPKSYKYFYDDEIRSLVEAYYKDDIEKYNYSFNDF